MIVVEILQDAFRESEHFPDRVDPPFDPVSAQTHLSRSGEGVSKTDYGAIQHVIGRSWQLPRQ